MPAFITVLDSDGNPVQIATNDAIITQLQSLAVQNASVLTSLGNILEQQTITASAISLSFELEDLVGFILPPGTHAGPFVSLEAYDIEAVLTSAVSEGNNSTWEGFRLRPGAPAIKNVWTDVIVAEGLVLAYALRVAEE